MSNSPNNYDNPQFLFIYISKRNKKYLVVNSFIGNVIVYAKGLFQIFPQDFSNFLDKWNYLEEKCPWLNLFIRVTKGGDHMLMVMVVDGGLDVIKERKNELVKYYTDDYTLTHKVKSIFIQPRKEK